MGIGWATVCNGGLDVIVSSAPQLGFFPRHLARAEALVKTARIKC